MYKKLVIKWCEGGLSFAHLNEKFIIDLNGISYKKWNESSLDEKELEALGFDLKKVTWKINIKDSNYIFRFNELCSIFMNTKDNVIRVGGCDVAIFDIELTLTSGEKIKEEFMCDLLTNGLDEFVIALEEFIPNIVDKPLFIGYEENMDLED